mmetsp:Transcript_3545/g.3997  ORF Transcript_3545/g.3997 Transcript_3545/m.3997 type:complete len:156 (+) Transcript_3545:58-525(+)
MNDRNYGFSYSYSYSLFVYIMYEKGIYTAATTTAATTRAMVVVVVATIATTVSRRPRAGAAEMGAGATGASKIGCTTSLGAVTDGASPSFNVGEGVPSSTSPAMLVGTILVGTSTGATVGTSVEITMRGSVDSASASASASVASLPSEFVVAASM